MASVIILGGSGVVGSIAARTLTTFPDFSKVVIGDINLDQAKRITEDIGSKKLSYCKVDALDIMSVKEIIDDYDVVLNCIGPFYKYGPSIVEAVIEKGKQYVDINDDVDATKIVLKMSEKAEQAGVTALIGMGSSPGVTNLLVKYAADQLLDEVETIDLYHVHGGEPTEGPGVIFHRIHSMSIDIPIFMNGEFKSVKFFDKDGKNLEEEVDFHKIGKFRVHPYPHPETITLPKFIKGVRRVTNKGTVLPPEYFYLITDLVKLGLTDENPLNVKGQMISPLDFTISYIIESRKKILKETQFGNQRGCLKIVVKGRKEGRVHQYIFSLASENQAMGEGTGIPAAIGAVLLIRGLVNKKGVLPPEACVDPLDFLSIMREHLELDKVTGEGSPLIVESIDENGDVERIVI